MLILLHCFDFVGGSVVKHGARDNQRLTKGSWKYAAADDIVTFAMVPNFIHFWSTAGARIHTHMLL